MLPVFWNPWHGCVKYSEGCANCYVFALDERRGVETKIHKNESSFFEPIRRTRGGAYRHAPGTRFSTCFTSDFFLEQADKWREDAFNIMRERGDCVFEFFTKRIARALNCLPPDWGDGYPNVHICVSIENQRRADERAWALVDFPAVRRGIAASPLLEAIDIDAALATGRIDWVSAGGEAYNGARKCDYDWVLKLRDSCVRAGVAFSFHQTGERFIKGGREYVIRSHATQLAQARKAGIDYSPTATNAYVDAPDRSV